MERPHGIESIGFQERIHRREPLSHTSSCHNLLAHSQALNEELRDFIVQNNRSVSALYLEDVCKYLDVFKSCFHDSDIVCSVIRCARPRCR